MFKIYDVFEYNGVGHATVLNRLLAYGVNVKRATADDKKLIIYTNHKDRQKIIALFTELCYNYKILKSVGLMLMLKNIMQRKGLLVSAFIAVIFFSIMPYFVLDIRIKSETISAQKIEQVLNENGVYKGKFLGSINTKKLEGAVQEIDGVAFATVERVGTALFVTIHEELPKVQIYDVTNIAQVIATTDAVISRQIVYSGTANYKKGDIVRANEVLISPYVLVGESKVDITAKGEVYGYVSYSSNIMYQEQRIEKQRSGNFITHTRLSFMGLVADEIIPPYTMYESVTTYYKGGLMIPLEKHTTTYFEIIDVDIFEPILDAQSRLVNKASEAVLEMLPPASRIMSKNVRVLPVGDYYMVEVVMQVEQRIDKVQLSQ